MHKTHMKNTDLQLFLTIFYYFPPEKCVHSPNSAENSAFSGAIDPRKPEIGDEKTALPLFFLVFQFLKKISYQNQEIISQYDSNFD
jgi:hypothetical protein